MRNNLIKTLTYMSLIIYIPGIIWGIVAFILNVEPIFASIMVIIIFILSLICGSIYYKIKT